MLEVAGYFILSLVIFFASGAAIGPVLDADRWYAFPLGLMVVIVCVLSLFAVLFCTVGLIYAACQ